VMISNALGAISGSMAGASNPPKMPGATRA
jgi:hypothetical protein